MQQGSLLSNLECASKLLNVCLDSMLLAEKSYLTAEVLWMQMTVALVHPLLLRSGLRVFQREGDHLKPNNGVDM